MPGRSLPIGSCPVLQDDDDDDDDKQWMMDDGCCSRSIAVVALLKTN